MQFSLGMRVMRAVRGQSQIELSVISGVNRDYIRLAENGEMELTDDRQECIRKALNWPRSIDAALDIIEQATFSPEAK
jgi:hypothetical protein